MTGAGLTTVLLYPPLLDPTAPYHSLAYLKAAAAAAGHRDTVVLDASIGAVRHVLDPGTVAEVLRERRARREELLVRATEGDGAGHTAHTEPGELGELAKVDLVDAGELAAAVAVLRDPEDFYDLASYRWAVDRVVAWMAVLGTLGVPGQFHGAFRFGTREWSAASLADLTDAEALERINRPFAGYYRDVLLPDVAARRPDVVGLNLTFTAQLPFALHLLRLLRVALPPATRLVVGGTEASDVHKLLADRTAFFRVFADADAAVIGEGETAFAGWLDLVAAERAGEDVARRPLPAAVRLNPARYAWARPSSLPPVLQVERLAALPAPDFSDVDPAAYLAPHPYVYVSPTRGCYWNKCAFCDYGLNTDAPTSPWRQEPIDQVVDELARVSRFAPFVYLSVDVLAPAMLHRLAERVRDARLDVSWGAEVRLERYWTPDKCRDLRAGGCVAVSVGFESANQRILDAMDKGTELATMRRTIEYLADAGIAVQIMAFTGFPGETYGEAIETVAFLESIRGLWTLGDVGEFVLTPGAFVARYPERYGVRDVRPRPGQDVHRSLTFTTDPSGAGPLTAEQERELGRRKAGLRVTELDRPWLGGVDTPHSYFYHARYGREVGRMLRPDVTVTPSPGDVWHLNGRLVDPPPAMRFSLTGRALTLSHSGVAGPVLLRRDGRAFRCPPDLAAALRPGGSRELDAAVDATALDRATRRALLARRLLLTHQPAAARRGRRTAVPEGASP